MPAEAGWAMHEAAQTRMAVKRSFMTTARGENLGAMIMRNL